jgi:Domain of unknown function (DUF4214)
MSPARAPAPCVCANCRAAPPPDGPAVPRRRQAVAGSSRPAASHFPWRRACRDVTAPSSGACQARPGRGIVRARTSRAVVAQGQSTSLVRTGSVVQFHSTAPLLTLIKMPTPSLRKLSSRTLIRLQAKSIVRAAYQGLLGRKPDGDGLAHYTKQLSADGDLAKLLSDLLSSEEFRERFEASLVEERAAALTYRNLVGVPAPPLDLPGPIPLTSRVCQQADFVLDAYRYWMNAIGEVPKFHRKQWEFFFVAQALHERKMLVSGSRGLGFGVGQEPLVALFASLGCEIIATDQETDEAIRAGWAQTGQHASGIEPLNARQLCDPESFSRLVRFEFANMNDIPDRYKTSFDFCWSACCLEHLGSLEHGLVFVERSLDTLKPGGVAVHTTEFNLTSNDETIESRDLSIYRRCDIERLVDRLTRVGHQVEPITYEPQNGVVDEFVDLPPFRAEPHLRLRVADFECTSIGLIVRKSQKLKAARVSEFTSTAS